MTSRTDDDLSDLPTMMDWYVFHLVAAIYGPRWDVYRDDCGDYVPPLAHIAIDNMVGPDTRSELAGKHRVIIGTLKYRDGRLVTATSVTAEEWHVSVPEVDFHLFASRPELTKQLVSAFQHIYVFGVPKDMEHMRDLERQLRAIRHMDVRDFESA